MSSSKQKQNKAWSPDEVETLITAFEARPILWDYKNKEYKNRVKTNLLHVELSEIFSTTPEEIARKLHNLRGQFSQEVTKLKKKKSGSGTNEIYVSNWRYFNALSFLLQGKEYQRNTTDTLTDPSIPAENEDTRSQQRAESQLSSVSDGQQPSSSQNKNLPHHPSKKRKEDTALLNKCAQIINQPSDDDQIFADYVASELRKLSKEGNKKLRRIIQRAIIDIQDEEDGLVPPTSPEFHMSSENTSSRNNYVLITPRSESEQFQLTSENLNGSQQYRLNLLDFITETPMSQTKK